MLLFFEKPYQDESLCSLLFRTAQLNLMDNLCWIFSNFIEFSNLHIISNEVNWISDEKLEKMAEFLSISNQKAHCLTFNSTLNHNKLERKSIEKNPWFLYSRTKCCPLCLREQIYHRKVWSSTYSLICTRHNSCLIDRCPECNNYYDIQSIMNNKCKNCNHKISTCAPKTNSIATNLTKYQTIIDNFVYNSHFEYSHTWINNSQCFIESIEFIGNWIARLLPNEELNLEEFEIIYDGKAVERNHLKNAKTIEQATCIYSYAFKILENWPNAFYNLLAKAEQQNNSIYNYFLEIIIPKLNGTQLWQISKELTNFITNIKMGILKNQYIRSDEVKFINKKFNAGILHFNELQSVSYVYNDIFFSFVNLDKLQSFFNKYENSLTKEELKEKWGTSSTATYTILQNNLIKNVISFTNGSANNWVIPQVSIKSFEVCLYSLSQTLVKPEVTLNYAFQWVGPEKSHVLLTGVLDHKISFQWTSNKLGECLVSKKDVFQYLKEYLLNKGNKSGFISLKDVTFLLGVRKSDIFYWLETHRFGKIEKGNPNNLSLKQYSFFNENYITSFELTIILNLNIKQILKKKSLGQFPEVAGPLLNDGRKVLYNRKKLKENLLSD